MAKARGSIGLLGQNLSYKENSPRAITTITPDVKDGRAYVRANDSSMEDPTLQSIGDGIKSVSQDARPSR